MSKRASAAVGVLLTLVAASPVAAAPRSPTASCWFTPDPLTLHIAGLPDTKFAITVEPYPIGVSIEPEPDGTFSWPWLNGYPAAYVWVRGHGPSLIKAGPGLNDYHLVAYCEVPTP